MKLPAKQKWHKEARAFFNEIKGMYEIDEKHRAAFYGTTDNLDRYNVASDQLNSEGITYKTESGQIKKHPACQIAKESWSGFLMGLKAMGLFEYQAKLGRPPGK